MQFAVDQWGTQSIGDRCDACSNSGENLTIEKITQTILDAKIDFYRQRIARIDGRNRNKNGVNIAAQSIEIYSLEWSCCDCYA
jgi:hypothetical protein